MEKLFRELDEKDKIFKSESGLQCVAGCGRCCLNPDIEATVLEFLPFALHYYKSGKADEILDQLNSNKTKICQILIPFRSSISSGFCRDFKYRGLICRLFGFSARRNKYNKLELITCKIIKENQPDIFNAACEKINNEIKVPGVGDYYMKLKMIDPELGGKTYPINVAISKAIDLVINSYYYKNSPGNRYRKIS